MIRFGAAILLVSLAACASEDRRPRTADYLAGDWVYEECDSEREYSGRETDFWTCARRLHKLLAARYGQAFDDLDEFRFALHISVAKRLDANIITPDQNAAQHKRINDAANTTRQRRTAPEHLALDPKSRADSLVAIATSLGAIVREQPPTADTLPDNLAGGAQIVCTRWQNVVNCN